MPDRSMEHLDKLLWMIETNGWALEPVAARPDLDPPRGRTCTQWDSRRRTASRRSWCSGRRRCTRGGIVGLVIDLLASGVQPPIGPMFLGLFDGDQRAALLPVDVDEHAGLFTSAAAFYGAVPFRVVQLAWPDRRGWMPWEVGFEQRLMLAQPVIGSLDEVE